MSTILPSPRSSKNLTTSTKSKKKKTKKGSKTYQLEPGNTLEQTSMMSLPSAISFKGPNKSFSTSADVRHIPLK